ncbi:hypothetical protein FOL47_005908 [Perkinsus chesapeaki]|uniref:Uncharacterized protein n=1 Tax=Perkinsus chesapeaki TaxID=330153 RepID=A0A7J6LUZ7_PERCH|nr:hypothetical protein FOL47_005908 [Perkinsus chesapeaki]
MSPLLAEKTSGLVILLWLHKELRRVGARFTALLTEPQHVPVISKLSDLASEWERGLASGVGHAVDYVETADGLVFRWVPGAREVFLQAIYDELLPALSFGDTALLQARRDGAGERECGGRAVALAGSMDSMISSIKRSH